MDLIIQSDLKKVLSKERIDVVIIATSSSFEKIIPTIKLAVNSGSNVISICEELSYPFQYFPKLSDKLNQLAMSNGVTVVGTGINPGFLMDLLPIVITAPCQSVESIKVTRMMNSAKRREPFQRKIGTGMTLEEFNKKQKLHDTQIKNIRNLVSATSRLREMGITLPLSFINIISILYNWSKEIKRIILEEMIFQEHSGKKLLKKFARNGFVNPPS